MSQRDQMLDAPDPRDHRVQLYGADERLLAQNVSRYLYEGLKRNDGLLVIATGEHTEDITRQMKRLGADPAGAVERGQLILLDARQTLGPGMAGDFTACERAVGRAIADLTQRPDRAGLRAFGEMVGLLWSAGKYSAAIRLEQLWNRLLNANSFHLYCAYPIDVFSNEFQIAGLDALLCAHTHVVPAGENGALESALDRSMDDLLGRRAAGLRRLMDANLRPSWAVMPRAEANILWLRSNLPDEAESILARARQYYQASHLRETILQAR